MDLMSNMDKALRFVRESRLVVYDTEASGVDWKKNYPIGYVVGAFSSTTRPEVVYVPVRHGGGGNIPGGVAPQSSTDAIVPHDFEVELAKAFRDRRGMVGGRVVGHNLKFDVHMSANAGIMMGRGLSCTQNRAALLDEYAKYYSLSECCKRAGVTPKAGELLYQYLASMFGGVPNRDQMQHYWKLAGNDPVAYEYAVGDGVSTAELYCAQQELMDEQELGVVGDLEDDLIWTIFRMERRGIKVDLGRLEELRDATEQQIRVMLTKFPLGFNVRSPLMMKQVFEDAGVTNWPKTPQGNPSFTEKWLKRSELGRAVVSIRQASNLINSFINPLSERHVHNGRVHATLNQLKSDDSGTISGRFSCSDPNLQQIPKRIKEIAKPFRRLFVADPGYVFWERDQSQAEPRLFAHYSGDVNLTKGYNAEPFVDAHQTVANLLGVERDPTAKRMNMGIFTGMQVNSFAGHMDWPYHKAEEAWNAWFETFPAVKEFQDLAKNVLKRRGYVKTLLGRRCRLEEPRFAYRGTSKIIQGSNADIIKYKLLEADKACEENGDIVQVLMTVHDSFNGQFQDTPVARALLQDITRAIADVQGPPFNLSVPFVLEGGEGGDWSEATFGVGR